MTDVGTFPTIVNVAPVMGHTWTAIGAGSLDLVPGMVVDFDATGASLTVQASLAVSGDVPIGVAITTSDVSAAEKVTVMTSGIAFLANADDTTGIDAGDWLITNDNAIGGTVSAASVAATGKAEGSIQTNVIGIALEDIAGSGTGRCWIQPNVITLPNST